MPKAKIGDRLNCEVCGLTVIVDEECGCAEVDIICCEEPMVNKGPATPRNKALADPPVKKNNAVNKVKSAAKKNTAMPVTKRTAAKKKAVKKAVKK